MLDELTESWTDWRQGVVAVIRTEFRDIFNEIDEGRSPQAAVDKAFVRNL